MKTLGIIGFGNMGRAIATGLTGSPYTYDVYDIQTHTAADFDHLCQHSEHLLLCVKPTALATVLAQVPPGKPLISVVAGVSLSAYPSGPVCRVMPNTAVATRSGVSAVCFNAASSVNFQETVHAIFSQMGVVIPIQDESCMHAVTALSGSGPAFIYRILQGFIHAGIQQGLSESLASTLVFKTLAGCLAADGDGLAALETRITQITSPNGTTEAGLAVLDAGITACIAQTIQASVARSRTIAKLY